MQSDEIIKLVGRFSLSFRFPTIVFSTIAFDI
jgi:hypothetical protein